MIRIEPETSEPPLFTTDQWLKASELIAEQPELHYDITEHRYKRDGITHTLIELWTWPPVRFGHPTRTHIDEDGEILLEEVADWITDEEWPAWVEPAD